MRFSHLDAAERHECALERLVGLETYDLFEILSFFGYVASRVACESGDNVRVHVEDAALCNFSFLKVLKFCPKFVCCFSWALQKRLVAVVGSIVFLDEVADVNFVLPATAFKACPCFLHIASFARTKPLVQLKNCSIFRVAKKEL